MLKTSFRFLGSIKFAVPLLTLISFILIVATIYESEIGTLMVQEMIYKSPWFGALMFLLALNLGASALSRYPWRGARKTGFALTHLGLIVIIAGSAAVIHLGTEGMLLVHSDRAANNQMRTDGDIVEVFQSDQTLFQEEIFVKPNGAVRPQTVGGIKLLQYAENTMQTVRFEPREDGDNLAVRLQLSSDRMGQDLTRYLALAPFSYQKINLGMASLEIQAVATQKELEEILTSSNQSDLSPSFQVLVSPEEELYYTAKSSQGFQSGKLTPNEPIATGWADFKINLVEVITHAEIQREVIPIATGETNTSAPGLLVEQDNKKQWLQWGEPTTINTSKGKVYVAFSPNLKELPFAIQLDDFIVERNEGSQSVAMWTSKITIKNSETGEEIQRNVWMNHPTWYKGWKIAQASWNPGDLKQSTLQIKREPMWVTALTFGGSGLVVLGIGVMFYGRAIAQKLSGLVPAHSEQTQETVTSLNS